MGLNVSEAMLLKAQYELEQFQPDDSAFDIVDVIITDESWDDYTRGYLTCKLEQWGESLDGKDLLEQFINFVEVILSRN
jgi:hypothetical protein